MTTPFPIRVTFRNLNRSEALEMAVRHWAERLAPLGSEILACGVVVEGLRRGWHRPKLFRVQVELADPGNDIIASSDARDENTARNPYAAVRQAFDAAERQLLDRAGQLRARAKPDRRSSEAMEEMGADQ